MAQGQNLAARVSADAIIVGGGLVGGALAQSLAGLGLHVAVVDRGNPQDWLDGRFDGRASAVALASQRFWTLSVYGRQWHPKLALSKIFAFPKRNSRSFALRSS